MNKISLGKPLVTKKFLKDFTNSLRAKPLRTNRSGQASMEFSNGFGAKRTNSLRITKRSKDSESSSSKFFNFKKKKSKNAQAAMEFLMTYGWVILIVLLVIGSLTYFGVLDPSRFLPESCILAPGLDCTDFQVYTYGLTMILTNSLGKSVYIPENQSKIIGCKFSDSISLNPGESKKITIGGCGSLSSGKRFKRELDLQVGSDTSSIIHSHRGEVIGKIRPPPSSCKNILEKSPNEKDGFYWIDPLEEDSFLPVRVFCDMTNDGGGWTLVWHGLPTQARFVLSLDEKTNIFNNISFDSMRMEGVNINFSVIDQMSETAVLQKSIPEYFNDVSNEPNNNGCSGLIDCPFVKFHDFEGNKEVFGSNNYFMKGYGNGWRVFYTCINAHTSQLGNGMYLGGYSPSCTPRNSFDKGSVGCGGTGNYYCIGSALDNTTKDTNLGLTLREYQETRVWVK